MKPSEDDEIDETRFIIKRQNTFMCFCTDKLKCLDMVSYLAPGFSYDTYLKVYRCKLQKGNFPFEYMDDVRKSTTGGRVLVGSKMKAYTTKTTLAARRCGTTTEWP